MSDKLQEIRERHADAIAKFGVYYDPGETFWKPKLKIGVQSFELDYTPPADDDLFDEDEHREWLGIMLCAALNNLVDSHTAEKDAEIERLRALLKKEELNDG